MKRIPLNDYLCTNNKWTPRLLGMEYYCIERNAEHIQQEYDIQKWGALLNQGLTSVEECRKQEFANTGVTPSTDIHFCIGDDIFLAPLSLVETIRLGWWNEVLDRHRAEHLCELGCGFGYNLSQLHHSNVYGGEISANAVQLGTNLGLDVSKFDYYNASDYEFLRPGTTIFTTHSIEQIPDATPIVDGLRGQRDKICAVVHFEPSFIKERTSLFGQIRNRYVELNDYNRNLFDLLRATEDIELLEYKADVFAINPLNSSNLAVWRFR